MVRRLSQGDQRAVTRAGPLTETAMPEENGQLEFLRTDANDPPVTAVREIRVRRGQEGPFELLMGALMDEARRQTGHLGSTIIRPQVPGEAYRFIYKFDRRSHIEAWHTSDLRATLFEPIRELVESDRTREYPGLETWFDLPGAAAPPKWKTTILSWLAIYPTVVAVLSVMHALKFEAPMPVRSLLLTAIVVPFAAFVAGPWMGRMFYGWLHPQPPTPRSPV